MEIFEKYADRPNKLPKTISNQKFNDYIKEVCKLAELNEVGRISARPKDILQIWSQVIRLEGRLQLTTICRGFQQ